MPLVLIDEPDGTYWSRWLKFFKKEVLVQGYISEMDFRLFDRVDSVDEAVKGIDRFYHRYHSLRYVRERLVIRLSSAIDQKKVEEVKNQFGDILTPKGNLLLSGPLPEESDEPEIAHLPRLILDFNRKDFGRLRELIDEINED
jgi:hypothetical protein